MDVSRLFSVAGKRVLVVGGSSGIGSMIAAGFVDAGATVAIVGRDEAALTERAAELSIGSDGSCTAIAGNVSTASGCAEIAEAAGAWQTGLDVLVHSAGSSSMAPLEDFGDEAWDDVLAVNLKGVAHLTRFLLPQLRAAGGSGGAGGPGASDAPARIITIGSIAGTRVSDMDNYAYTSSKAALHHLTRHLARRLAPAITVNAIAPGPFESRMTSGVLASHGEAIVQSTPMRRIGHPDDVAGAALYLSSHAGAWITGTVLTIDGGHSLT